MRLIDHTIAELAAALKIRGRARRRILGECRDHLLDAAAEHGEAEAVRAFGAPATVAAAFDTEYATRRTLRATILTAAGVLLTGGSTLALINSADAGLTGPNAWTVVFFVAAQLSATAVVLAVLQALAQRHATATAGDLALLSRRNVTALIAAGVTMFAAGAAVPGQGSAVVLLAGPAVSFAAFVGVLAARRFTRRLPGARDTATHPPLADLQTLIPVRIPQLGTAPLLVAVSCLAAAAAFARDTAEHATAGGAAVTASVEAAAVIACFLVLGRALGLWRERTTSSST